MRRPHSPGDLVDYLMNVSSSFGFREWKEKVFFQLSFIMDIAMPLVARDRIKFFIYK